MENGPDSFQYPCIKMVIYPNQYGGSEGVGVNGVLASSLPSSSVLIPSVQ